MAKESSTRPADNFLKTGFGTINANHTAGGREKRRQTACEENGTV